MILHAEGSFLNGRREVSIDVQPHTELEHEILLLFFQNRSVSLGEAHEGDKLAVSFSVSDTTLEALGFRNLERVKSGQPRFMSVAAEQKAAADLKAASEAAKKAAEDAQSVAQAKSNAAAKERDAAIVERAAQLLASGAKEKK